MAKKEKAVDVVLDLGDLKPLVRKAARRYGQTMNEFICDSLESAVRRDQSENPAQQFVYHNGKHKFGKHTGYEVTEDGKYYPASVWTERFDQLFAERSAIHLLAETLLAQSQERAIKVEALIQKAKAEMIDDWGLDPSKEWVYYGQGRYMAEAKTEEQTDETKQ